MVLSQQLLASLKLPLLELQYHVAPSQASPPPHTHTPTPTPTPTLPSGSESGGWLRHRLSPHPRPRPSPHPNPRPSPPLAPAPTPALAQAACLLLAALLFELNSEADRAAALTSLVAHPLSFLAASSLGMVMQVATLVVVRVSGPVTVKLLGIVRNAAIVLSEVARGNTPGTPQQLAGYSLSLAAFGCYTRLRMQGTNKPKAA